MKIPDFDPWAFILFLIGVPIIRAIWVVMWDEAARTSFEVGSSLFLILALPPLACGFVFWAALVRGGHLFQTLRHKRAALKTLTGVAIVSSFLTGLMLIILAGSYFGKVPEIFLSPTKQDWKVFLNSASVLSLAFMLPFAAAIYEEWADRKDRE